MKNIRFRKGSWVILPALIFAWFYPTPYSVKAIDSGYPTDLQWEAITYGNGKFVAVASSGSGNRVMTSTDGDFWTSQNSASDSNWQGITYADSQFVAVGSNAIMTSPDGIQWTSKSAPTGEWQAITNCGGLFVATATWGSNYVMTSTNGSDWTVRTPAYAWSHDAVACSATVPRFVSVSQYGRGWSSANGISGWSVQNPGAIVDIRTVAFGNGRFSWLEWSTNTGNRYGGYSTNGLNWSAGLTPANQWKYITYGGDRFVAVAEGGSNSRVAYSTDGANWALGSGAPSNSWQGVAYGAGKYVAVANSGTSNRVMTSSDGVQWNELSVTTTTTTTTTTTIPPTTTTTLAPYYNPIQNFTATANEDGSVLLDWDAPEASNTEIYGYSINFVDYDNNVERGGWGIWTVAANTSYSLSTGMFSGSNPVTTGYGQVRFKVYAMSGPCAGVGQGSCLYGPSTNADATVLDPTPPTTTTTTTTSTTTTTTTTIASDTTVSVTTTIDIPISTTTTEVVINIPEAPTTTVEVISSPGTLPEAPAEVFPQPTPDVIPDPEPIIIEIPAETTSSIPEEVDPNTILPDETLPELVVLDPDTTIGPSETLPFVGEVISDAVLTNILEDTFTPDASTEEITAALDNILSADLTTEQFTAVMDAVLANTSDTEQVSEVLVSLLSSNLSGEELTIVMDTVFSAEASVEEMSAIVENLLSSDLSSAELTAVFTAAFDGDLSDAETISLAEDVLSQPVSTEELTAVITAIFDEVVSDEVLTSTFTAVLEQPLTQEAFAAVVNVLESDTISSDQVSQVVDLVINQDGGVSADQATELATSPKVLESIDGSQATEVFDAIVVSEVTAQDGLAISQALVNAPTEVKEAFEEQLNIFEGVFDIYVPTGSSINVGVRRTFVAVTAIATTLTSAAGAAPLSGGSSGGSGGSPAGGGGMPDNEKSSKIKRRKGQPRRRIK